MTYKPIFLGGKLFYVYYMAIPTSFRLPCHSFAKKNPPSPVLLRRVAAGRERGEVALGGGKERESEGDSSEITVHQ